MMQTKTDERKKGRKNNDARENEWEQNEKEKEEWTEAKNMQ